MVEGRLRVRAQVGPLHFGGVTALYAFDFRLSSTNSIPIRDLRMNADVSSM